MMIKKILLSISGVIALFITGGLSHLYLGLPDVGTPPKITVEGTPQQIERGKDLAGHVSICMVSHRYLSSHRTEHSL